MKRKLLLAALCVVGAMGGVNSLSAQTDVTSTYLQNPSFETLKASDGTTDVTVKTTLSSGLYGWEVPSMSNYQVESEASGSSSGFVNGGKIVPTDGTYYYFNRQGWGNKDSELKTTTKVAVAPGNYYFVFDYKAADYSNNSNASPNGTTIGITVKDASSNIIATLAAAKIAYSITNGGSNPGSDAYMRDAPWSKKGVAFTVTSSSVLTFAVQQNMKNSGRSDIVYDNFKLYKIDDASNVDFTGYIANPGFEANNTNGWTGTNDGGDPAFAQGNKQQWNGSFSFSQPLAGLPNGKYKITVQGFYRPGGNGAELNAQNALLFAGNATEPLQYVSSEAKAEKDTDHGFTTAYGELGYVPNSQTDAKKTFEYGAYDGNELSFYVTNHTITVGTKKDVKLGNDWTVWDNFKLYLQELAIENYAETYVSSVTADKWYVYDVSIDGDYKFVSDVANTVTYTQVGTDIATDVSTNETLTADTKKVVALTAGKLYFKVSADATLTVAPNVYSYSVGDATLSVADNGYTQSNTMTFTFADATTNDPDGALSILDASKIKVDGVAASASIDGNVLTVTLASPVATSTDYAVSIEAGAVGYNTDNTNAAISLTAKTPVVFDGTYFIATTDGTKFISRGGDSNTEATLDEFGIAVNFTTDASNVTHIQFVDNDKNLFGGSSSVYTDKNESDLGDNAARARWTVAAVTGGYSLYCGTWSKYIKAGTGAESGKEAATYDESAYAWTLVTPAAHAALMATYKDANAAAVATSAGLSASTVAALETALASGFVSEAVTPSNAYSSVTEKYQPNGYSETIISEQELTGLKNGIYKVTLSAFHRIRGYAETYTCSQNNTDNPISYLYANDQKVQIPSPLTEGSNDAYSTQDSEQGGKHYPNGMTSAGEAFTAGKYKVVVYAVVTDGTLKIGLKDPGKYSNANWICFRDLAVTSYVFNGDYSALETAIATAESNLGFEDGENAPYNNVASMGKLATAKALYASQDGINQATIDAVTDALTGAVWTANVGEVNAVYDGTFANATNNGAPAGWISTTHELGGSGHSRAFVGENRLSEFNGTNSAFFIRYDGTWSNAGSLYNYGTTDGYTMPLKANTYYYIQADFAGWGSKGNPLKMLVTGPNDFSATSGTVNTSYNADTESEYTPQQFYFVFETSAAGNYVIKFQNPSDKTHMAVVSNIELKKCNASATMLVKAGQWGTFIAPFDVTIPDGVNAYTVTGVNANDYMVKEAVETTILANTPVLLENTTETLVNTTFYGKNISEADSYTKGQLTGIYTAATIPAGSYVLQTPKSTEVQAFYPLATTLTGTPNRCYLTLPNSAAKRNAIFFDKEEGTTGIEAPNATNGEDGVFYNLAGQRVNRSYKGIIIHNRKAKLNN